MAIFYPKFEKIQAWKMAIFHPEFEKSRLGKWPFSTRNLKNPGQGKNLKISCMENGHFLRGKCMENGHFLPGI